MGKALHQMWQFFTIFFSALTKTAQTVDNIATVGEEMSHTYLESTRTDRALAAIENKKQLEAAKQLTNNKQTK